jgi:PAS domain S-box-containing protein
MIRPADCKTKTGYRRVLSSRRIQVVGFVAALIFSAGLWVAKQAGTDADLQMRRRLVDQAEHVAAAVDPSVLKSLSFTGEDRSNSGFIQLCAQMGSYAELMEFTSLYTMALRDGQIVFGPESLPQDHPYASPPGTVYQDPSAKDYEIFKTGEMLVQGPFQDEYGEFVTASVPVTDPSSGEVLAVIGIDAEASDWRAAVRRAQLIPAAVTLILLGFFVLIGLAWDGIRHRLNKRWIPVRYAEAVICGVFLALLTLAVALRLHHSEQTTRTNTFYALASSQAAAFMERMNDIDLGISQMARFFESSDAGVTRDEFRHFCRPILDNGAVAGCFWIPEVPAEAADSFVQSVQHSGFPEFQIWHQDDSGNRVRSAGEPVYYPVLYLEPLDRHKAGLGYNLLHEKTRCVAVQAAMKTDTVVASDPVILQTSNPFPPRVYVFKRVEIPHQKGVVAVLLRPEHLLGGGERIRLKRRGLDASFIQLSPGSDPLVVAESSAEPLSREARRLELLVPSFIFGKTYVFSLGPRTSWLAANPLRQGRIALGIGLLLTLLVSSVIALITSRRDALAKQVAQRTAELREREENYRLLFEATPDAVFAADTETGEILDANRQAERLIGRSRAELLQMNQAGLHPDPEASRDLFQNSLRAFGSGVAGPYETEVLHRDGRRIPVEIHLGTTCIGGREVAIGNFHNLTERKRAAHRIHQLVQHLETVREEERKRLSRELHDDLGQILTALKIDLVMIKDECTCTEDVKRKMDDMQHLLSEGIQCVHSLCRRLRPGALDDLDLEDALSGLITDWQKRNSVPCILQVDADDEALSDPVKIALFRMAQEALTNVSRYAAASGVQVDLVTNDRDVDLSIRDDGCGMEPGAVDKPTSFGLLGMRERIETLGGTLEIESEPGRGTTLHARIPLGLEAGTEEI